MQATIKRDFKTRSKQMWKEMKEAKHLYVLMAPFIILFFTFTIIPVVMSLGISFTQFNMLEAPRFVGFDNYIKLLLDDEIFIIAIRNTLVLAVVTGPVSYLLAFVFAWLINEPKLFILLLLCTIN